MDRDLRQDNSSATDRTECRENQTRRKNVNQRTDMYELDRDLRQDTDKQDRMQDGQQKKRKSKYESPAVREKRDSANTGQQG